MTMPLLLLLLLLDLDLWRLTKDVAMAGVYQTSRTLQRFLLPVYIVATALDRI